MRLKQIAVSLLVAAAAFGPQAYAANPERNDWLQADYGKAPPVAQTPIGSSAPLAQLDTAKAVDRDGIKAASATAPKSADTSATAFPNLMRVTQ